MTEKQLRERVVGIAKGWLGYSEASRKHRVIVDLYNKHKPLPVGYKVKYTDSWCATFASAVGMKAELSDIIFPECSCPRMIQLYKKAGRWQEKDSYTPQPGDLIMYDWADTGAGDNVGNPDHVGIVTSVNDSYVQVIEGNKNNTVGYRSLKINGKFIRGYCLPDYASKATNSVTTTNGGANTVSITLNILKRGSKGAQVRALQALLINSDFGVGVSGIDGSFGPATLAAVKKFQAVKKLTQDGIVGEKTWAALLGA